jgi:hypothetical protein
LRDARSIWILAYTSSLLIRLIAGVSITGMRTAAGSAPPRVRR